MVIMILIAEILNEEESRDVYDEQDRRGAGLEQGNLVQEAKFYPSHSKF